MAEQAVLFHDSVHDAIGSVVKTLGGKKKVAPSLWPHAKPETAYTRLAHCLTEDMPEKLSPDELIFLARSGKEAGDHSIMQYLAAELGYSIAPIEPRDELAALYGQYIETAKAMRRIAERIERSEHRPELRVAK